MIRQLIAHTAAYTFATLASRGAFVVLLVVLPALLSVRDYGVLGLATTASALVQILVPLEVTQALARYYPTAGPSEKGPLLRSAFTFTLVMLGSAAALALVFAAPLTNALLSDPGLLPAFRMAVLLCAANTLFLFVQGQLRWEFRAADYVRTSLILAVATLTLSLGLAAWMSNSLVGAIVGQAAGAAVAVAYGVWRLRSGLAIGIDRQAIARLLRYSLPLVPASLALFASNYAGRLIMQDLTSLEEVGLFTWAAQLAGLPSLLMLGVQAAVTPYVMKHHAEPACPVLLARAFEAVLVIQLILCVWLGLIAPVLIDAAGYRDYRESGPLVLVLAPAAMLLQLYIFAPGFAVAERTRLQLGVSLAGAAVAIAANYLLIGPFGAAGAAAASLIAAMTFMLLWFALSQRIYPLPLRLGRLAVFVAAGLLIAALGQLAQSPGIMGAVSSVIVALFLTAVALGLGLVRLDWLKHLHRLPGAK